MKRKIIVVISLVAILVVVAVSAAAYFLFREGGDSGIAHDVAVTGVALSKNETHVGDVISITVTVENKGDRNETFEVEVFGNQTQIGTAQTVANLGVDAETSIVFSWNTMDMQAGNYVVRAEASTVAGESSTSDNVFSGVLVFLREEQHGPVFVSVYPMPASGTVGGGFTVEVRIAGVVDLHGWQVTLRWNTALIDVVDVTEQSFLKSNGTTLFTQNYNNTAGNLTSSCTLLGERPGVSGSGTLLSVQFHAKSAGTGFLTLASTLSSSLEQPIDHSTANGIVTVSD
jgi:hypothetical protein